MSYKQDIIQLRKQGKSYDEIKNELGCSRSTISYHCNNENLQDIGLENRKEKLSSDKRKKIKNLRQHHTISEVSRKLSISESTVIKYSEGKNENELKSKEKTTRKNFVGTTQHKGLLAESKVKTRFIELGYTVLEPQLDKRYDIVVEENGEFNRIQVKSSRYKNGCVRTGLTWGSVNTNKTKKYKYGEDDIEYFAIWNKQTDKVYVLPREFGEKTQVNLRIEEPKNGQTDKINFAKDYILDDSTEL
jgi:DNA-binding CsgD family transcriptional regulator